MGVIVAEEHEIRETFRYKDKKIFNPHFDATKLVEFMGKLVSVKAPTAITGSALSGLSSIGRVGGLVTGLLPNSFCRIFIGSSHLLLQRSNAYSLLFLDPTYTLFSQIVGLETTEAPV